MSKIGLKSGEIVQKHDFTTDFTCLAQNSNCEPLFPPAPGVKRVLAEYNIITHDLRFSPNDLFVVCSVFLSVP
jgi:hypothetical protein